MKDINDIIFIITARINSTRIEKKMIKPIANTNLFEIMINKLLSSKIIPKNNLYLSIGDKELLDIAEKYKNIKVFHRSEISVNTNAKGIEGQKEALEWIYTFKDKYKYYFWINCCQPFLKIETIDSFINKFLSSPFRSIISVNKIQDYFWDDDGKLDKEKHHPGETLENFVFNTRFVKPTFKASHSLQIGNINDLINNTWLGTFEKNDPEIFEINEGECFDIDYDWQFEIAKIKYLNNIKVE